jgi:hypothetical protein
MATVDDSTTKPASIGIQIGDRLVKDMRDGRIALDISPNRFPKFPGKNERDDHNGFLNYLDSELGRKVLEEMARSDEQYLFV